MQARVWHDHREVSAGGALSGDTPRLRPGRFYGRAEPAPPGGEPRRDGLPEKAPGSRDGRFSRRDAVSASANTGGMQARVWHDHREVSAGRALSGDTPRSGPCALRGRAEPAPPGGQISKARWPCGGRPGDRRKGRFSRRDALCASAWYGRDASQGMAFGSPMK
jgi:hypothetical protein